MKFVSFESRQDGDDQARDRSRRADRSDIDHRLVICSHRDRCRDANAKGAAERDIADPIWMPSRPPRRGGDRFRSAGQSKPRNRRSGGEAPQPQDDEVTTRCGRSYRHVGAYARGGRESGSGFLCLRPWYRRRATSPSASSPRSPQSPRCRAIRTCTNLTCCRVIGDGANRSASRGYEADQGVA